MGIFAAFRRFRHPGPIALLLALALRPAGFLFSELLSHQHLETPVEAARIAAPGSGPEACEHHPAGCPKDCFCPKIPIHADSGAETVLAPGELHQPALAHCTGRDGSDELSAGPVFQAPEWVLQVPAGRLGRLLRAPHSALLPQEADSPLKIPIG